MIDINEPFSTWLFRRDNVQKRCSVLDEAVFKHSTHIEDLVFTEGKSGVQKAIDGFKHIMNTIGKSSNVTEVQRKVDGAPAIVFGYLNDKFFVASKALFNKTPKINYTKEDCDNNHEGNLADVLKSALDYLPKVCPKGKIYQGDFVFSSSSRSSEKIDGVPFYTFQPNTIKYAVEEKSDLGKAIGSAKFGIVVHTEYKAKGPEVQDIELDNFDVSEDEFMKSADVWLTDTNHKDVSKIAPFQGKELSQLNSDMADALKLAGSIKFNEIKDIVDDLMTFVNTYIRDNRAMPDSDVMRGEFINYIKAKMEKELASKKTDKAKEKVLATWSPKIESAEKSKSLPKVFDLHKTLTAIKLTIINKLESIKTLQTFLVKADGSLEVTGSEGYVLAQSSAKSCKLVDRYQFSKANFCKEYLKGWEH